MTTFATAFNNLITKINNNFTWLKTQITSLNTAVGNKAAQTDLTTHTGNTTVHITAAERTSWNAKASSTDLTTHTGDTTVHITSAERTTWNNKQSALSAQQLANIADVPNKADTSDIPTTVAELTDSEDYATKDYVDSKVATAVRHQGSVAFANLPALTEANLNKCYNVTDAFTTTSDFIEGAGKGYPAGTNVIIVESGNSYKYDVEGSFYNLSIYYEIDDLDTDLSSMFTTGTGNITDLSA